MAGYLTAADDDTDALNAAGDDTPDTPDTPDAAAVPPMAPGALDSLSARYPEVSAIRSGYQAAIDRLKAQRAGLSGREQLGALLVGFAQPTRHGNWREGVANASQALLTQTMAARKGDAAREALIAKYMAEEGPKALSGAVALGGLDARTQAAKEAAAKAQQGAIQVLPPMYPGAPTQAVRKRFDAQGNPIVEAVPIGAGGMPAPATPGAPSAAPNFPVQVHTGAELAAKYGITGYDPNTKYQIQTAGADAGKVSDVPLADPLAKYGGATGPALLQSLSPADRAMVDSLHEGRMLAPNAGTRAKEAQRLLALTQAAYPDWNATQGQLAFKTRQQYLPGGPIGKNIVSFETAISHLNSLAKNAADLHNTDFPLLNAPKNAIAQGTGSPAITGFMTDRQAVSDELMRAFRMTGASQREAEDWQNRFSAAASPAQINEAVTEATNLLAGRLDSLVKPYNDATGENRSFLSWMSPKSRTAFLKLNPNYDVTDDDKRFLAQLEVEKRRGATPAASSARPAVRTPASAAGAAGGAAIPASLLQQYRAVPFGNKAQAKARLKAGGYDISGLD